jgi:dTDP-4-amino-4,6-dideoxygalactose transaminase
LRQFLVEVLMAIPLLDLKRQYTSIREDAMRVTEEIYESQAFILGPRVVEFEKDFASYCHSKHAVGLSSGTDALLIALMVLDLEPGDEVIVPAYSFFATAGVVERLGLIPVFADIDPGSFNIDPKELERRITSKTRAVMPVHLYGQMADMEAIHAICDPKKIHVIEDAAQAVGAEYDGKRAGAHSIIGCFSFFPSKNLGGFGDSGAVTTNDDALNERLLDFRVHGMRPKYFHKYVGGNFRIDALQAAILHIKMRHLDAWTEGRRKNADRYASLFSERGLEGKLVWPSELPRRKHVYNQYVVRFPGDGVRDRVMDHLRQRGIGCEIYYPLTLPQQECFRNTSNASDSFPHSDRAAAETLAIPVFAELRDEEIQQVADEIAKALGA